MSRYKPYPTYKNSCVEWLGQVLEHWIISKVKWEFEARLGKMLQPAQNNDSEVEVPYHKAVSVQWEIVASEAPETMWGSSKDIETYQIRCGDLLICEGGEVGRAAIFKEDVSEPLIIQNSLHRVRPKNDNLNEVLLRIMQTVHSARWFEVLCSKATIVHFTGEKLGDLAFPVAPINEQKAIVAYLERETARIDALVNAKTRFIELLREKRQALITHAVTKGLDPNVKMKDSGVKWLGQVPEHWLCIPLKWRTRCKSGISIGVEDINSDADNLNDIPVIGGNGLLGFARNSNVVDSVLAIGRVGALCGNVHIINTPAWITDNALILDITTKDFDINYLAAILKTRNLNSLASKSAQPLITGTLVGEQMVAIPPIDEQIEIIEFLTRKTTIIDALINKTVRSIELLKERRATLITAAVTGQIDLREVEE